jgi:bacteriocin biosynthesis cyclodehydratase domain-containing protein
VIGAMMALEAVKLITGAGEPLTGRLLIYDALAGETRTVRLGTDPECPECGAA